jgi:hypothetical protein
MSHIITSYYLWLVDVELNSFDINPVALRTKIIVQKHHAGLL